MENKPKKRIFILEDNPEMSKLYRCLLKDYQLVLARSVTGAIELLNDASFDLHILDIHLGKYETCFKLLDLGLIRENVLFVSAFSRIIEPYASYKFPMLEKPIANDTLILTVKSLLNESDTKNSKP